MGTIDAHKNFAYSTVLTAPSPASSGTSLVVQSGDGAKFPAVPFNVSIWPAGVQPTTANAEIARVTVASTDTFTITRAQEGSSARTVIVGDQIGNTITNKTLTDVEQNSWQFIGTATGATTTVGPVTTTGTFQEFLVYYFIAGYNGGTPIGRLLMANGTPSTTALNNGNNLREAATGTAAFTATTAASIPGIPLSINTTSLSRAGKIFIDGASGSFKSYQVIGMNGNASVSAPPTQFLATGWFSDLGTNLSLKQFQLTVYDTLATVAASSQTFTAGTYLIVWGRNLN